MNKALEDVQTTLADRKYPWFSWNEVFLWCNITPRNIERDCMDVALDLSQARDS